MKHGPSGRMDSRKYGECWLDGDASARASGTAQEGAHGVGGVESSSGDINRYRGRVDVYRAYRLVGSPGHGLWQGLTLPLCS